MKKIISIAILSFVFALPFSAQALETRSIDAAILWLVRRVPRHPVHRSDYRAELAAAIDAAALETELDAALILSIAYHESALRADARGRIGEIGLMQIHGVAAAGADLSTPRGQILAGTRWLRACVDRCRSIEGGIARYATGTTCDPDHTPRLRYLIASRLATRAAILAWAGVAAQTPD